MSEQNKQVVLKFIEAMGACDPVIADQCLAPDAMAIAKGFANISGPRHRDTMVGTIDAFKKIVPTGLRPTIKNVVADGDQVAVEWEGDAVASSGKPYRNQYCMVFTVRGGKITQVNEYFCTKLADEVLWPLFLGDKSIHPERT